MKISELIYELKEYLINYGDYNITSYDNISKEYLPLCKEDIFTDCANNTLQINVRKENNMKISELIF